MFQRIIVPLDGSARGEQAIAVAGKKPPNPPAAPTRSVTVPACPRPECDTSLKTAPLPIPNNRAMRATTRQMKQ